MIFKILKGTEEIFSCQDEKEFIQKVNDLHSIYCTANKITKLKEITKLKDAEGCLYFIGYIYTKSEEAPPEVAKASIPESKPETKTQEPNVKQKASKPAPVKYLTDVDKIEIHKISIGKEASCIYVEYEDYTPGKNRKSTVYKGFEPCKPELIKEFQDLNINVCEILDFPSDWQEQITVTGVSISWKENELFGIVLTAKMQIIEVNAPFNINTPFLRFESNSEKVLSDGCWYAVNEILNLTKAYMMGDTAYHQLGLFNK